MTKAEPVSKAVRDDVLALELMPLVPGFHYSLRAPLANLSGCPIAIGVISEFLGPCP